MAKTMGLTKHLAFGLHRLFSHLKIHVLPVHYYSPVVDLLDLEAHQSDWARRSEMPGIIWDGQAQLQAMRDICLPFQNEYKDNLTFTAATNGQFGPGYGAIEAQALHGFIRHFKPKRIIEVGSGISTVCMLAAAKLNEAETGNRTSVTCVEPYPSEHLKTLNAQNKLELIDSIVQRVSSKVFEELGEGDLLFIDSSHATKTGSDVNYLYLEILPRLKPGVLIHIHDIYFPYDYSPMTLRTLWHWGETALLRAYMTNNSHIKTIFCMSFMHHDYSDAMKNIFPAYDPEPIKDGLCVEDVGPMGYPKHDFPCSIYLRVV